MTALIIIGVVVMILLLIGASGGAARPAPSLRRQAPPDPIIDTSLDPLIAPWADEPEVWQRRDGTLIDSDDEPFEPGGGSFGGGGASGDWGEDDGEAGSGND